jgi:hypothetical protein
MTESNEKETDVKYDLTEILTYYKNELSFNALVFNGSKYSLKLFMSIVIMFLPLLIIWFFKDKLGIMIIPVYLFALIIAVLGSIFGIINPHLKNNEYELLKNDKKTDYKHFFALWSIDNFSIYRKKELRKYFEKREITELEQFELISKEIDIKLSKKAFLILKIGIPFSILGTLWVQINQQIIKTVSNINTLLVWGLSITFLIFVIWCFLNQVLELRNIIMNAENRRNEELNDLLKEIIFEMRMKKYSLDTQSLQA